MKIDIDPQTEANLKELAASGNIAPEILAAEMLAQQTQDRKQAQYWRERTEDMAAIQRYKETKQCIAEDDMFQKMDNMIEEAQDLANRD